MCVCEREKAERTVCERAERAERRDVCVLERAERAEELLIVFYLLLLGCVCVVRPAGPLQRCVGVQEWSQGVPINAGHWLRRHLWQELWAWGRGGHAAQHGGRHTDVLQEWHKPGGGLH